MSEPKVRRHVWVTGRVQGVFYRETTRQLAETRNVAGWVKNLPDGRVEAVFEGRLTEVDSLLEFCRHGPDSAEVAMVEVKDEEPMNEHGFRILK